MMLSKVILSFLSTLDKLPKVCSRFNGKMERSQIFSDDTVVLLEHSLCERNVCSLAWRLETALLRQVIQYTREHGNGYRDLSRVVAQTMKTRRKLKKLQEKTGERAGKRRPEVLDLMDSFLSYRPLAKWPSFSEETCVGDEVVVENLYSIFTYEPLHNFHLWMSGPFKKG